MKRRIEYLLNINIPGKLHYHHIDTNRKNNSIENIIVLDRKSHMKLHREMKEYKSLKIPWRLRHWLLVNEIPKYKLVVT